MNASYSDDRHVVIPVRFFKMPKFLFEWDDYKYLSNEAKLLYGSMLDRLQLSKMHRICNVRGVPFIYYTLDSIQGLLHCCEKTAVKRLKELNNSGLITVVYQGKGNASHIYVREITIETVNRNE